MTAARVPAGAFPFAPGSGVRAWGEAGIPGEFAVTVADGAVFLACCRAHAASGRAAGYFPAPSDLEGMTPATAPESCPPGPGFLRGAAAARHFRVGYRTLTGWVMDGKLTSYPDGDDSRYRLYDPAEITALLTGEARLWPG